jgi:ribonuclease P protein component
VGPPETQPGETFTALDRLRRRRDFDEVYSRGSRVTCRHFVLFILPNTAGRSRLGVTLGRRIGKAVDRNRTRRRLREIFRRGRTVLGSFDVVIHGRPGIARSGLRELEGDFLSGVARFNERWNSGSGR